MGDKGRKKDKYDKGANHELQNRDVRFGRP
jgi:hypothetical protein